MFRFTRHGVREMIVGSVVLFVLGTVLGLLWHPLSLLVLPVWIWLFAFFRDPERPISTDQHLMVSPADGLVSDVEEIAGHEMLGEPCLRIGIFLSVFNVHVNRAPCDGKVAAVVYKKGKFINAMSHNAASSDNESNTILLADPASGKPIAVVKQIVGLIARRISAKPCRRRLRPRAAVRHDQVRQPDGALYSDVARTQIERKSRAEDPRRDGYYRHAFTRDGGGGNAACFDEYIGRGDRMSDEEDEEFRRLSRAERRLRMRRRGRKAYIRSVYFLPSLATLGNAICGFGAMYVAALLPGSEGYQHRFMTACYLIFASMIFDALDGRLARFARHTTDFGGQLDSMSDVISFGAAPAFISLMLFKNEFQGDLPFGFSRLIWAIGALYMSCAAIRLARFNVSNEHGEQAHFSFLGLPSPGAGGAVVGFILMQQEFRADQFNVISTICIYFLPLIVLMNGLLMISNIRYPHLVNRYLRGKRPMGKLVPVVALVLCMAWNHRITIGIATLIYAFWGLGLWIYPRTRVVPSPSGIGLG